MAFVMLITIGFAGNGLAADGKSLTADALLPIVKEIISKLSAKAENPDDFPAPSLKDSTVTSDGDKIKVSGRFEFGGTSFGNTDISIINNGTAVEVSGVFPDWSGQIEGDTQGLQLCDTKLEGSRYKLLYDIKLKAFSEIVLEIKRVSAICSNGQFDLAQGTLKSKLYPTSKAGEYISKNTLVANSFSMKENMPNAQLLKEAYNFSFGFDIGPVNLTERAERIGLPYEEFWPVTLPSISHLADSYFLLTKPGKYLPIIEKLETFKVYLGADKFKDSNFIRTNKGKNTKMLFDILNLYIKTTSDDSTNIELPNADLSINVSGKGDLEIKASEKIDPKALSELIQRSLISNLTLPDFFQVIPQPLNLAIKTHSKNETGTMYIDGTMSVVGVLPNISLTLKIDNFVELFNSMFSFKGTPDPEVKACLDSVTSALKTLEPLAMKNSQSKGRSWTFYFKGIPVPGPMTINGEDPASLRLPAFQKVQEMCSPVIPRIMRR